VPACHGDAQRTDPVPANAPTSGSGRRGPRPQVSPQRVGLTLQGGEVPVVVEDDVGHGAALLVGGLGGDPFPDVGRR